MNGIVIGSSLRLQARLHLASCIPYRPRNRHRSHVERLNIKRGKAGRGSCLS